MQRGSSCLSFPIFSRRPPVRPLNTEMVHLHQSWHPALVAQKGYWFSAPKRRPFLVFETDAYSSYQSASGVWMLSRIIEFLLLVPVVPASTPGTAAFRGEDWLAGCTTIALQPVTQ
jgi:hypothetical protein